MHEFGIYHVVLNRSTTILFFGDWGNESIVSLTK